VLAWGLGVGLPTALTSSVKEKTEPLPSSDLTPMVPLCAFTRLRTMDSPSPVPPYLRELTSSTCVKGWKICPMSFFGIPSPVSLTETCRQPPRTRVSCKKKKCPRVEAPRAGGEHPCSTTTPRKATDVGWRPLSTTCSVHLLLHTHTF
jgi:hypothetical protein